jgi:hypothetical protein
MNKGSQDTALRDIQELIDKGILINPRVGAGVQVMKERYPTF